MFMSDYRVEETFQCVFVPVMLICFRSRKDAACMGVCLCGVCVRVCASD